MIINSILCVSLLLVVNISGLNAATCSYSINPTYGYSCKLSAANLNNPNGTLTIYGAHDVDKSDIDVKFVNIQSFDSSIITVPADILNKFTNLNRLELTSAKIKTININSFAICENLNVLNLESNKISTLLNGHFENCKNLNDLNLRRNSITIIESDAFSGLTKLERLDISYNLIIQLEFNIADSTMLNYFDLSYNEVSAVKTDFHTSFEDIEYLDGNHNNCIDEDYKLGSTTKTLASVFQKCYQKYQELLAMKALQVNCKYYINNDYGYTSEISNVNSMLETDIFNITGTHLEGKTDFNVTLVLVLRSSFISVPSELFTKYPALSYLSMSNAGITTLNENSFDNAVNLKIIWLNKNKITKLPAFLFTKTPKLEHLMLIQNQISEINIDAFYGNSRLLRLDMTNNKLQTLQSGLLQSSTNLEILMLTNNEINFIGNDAFKGLIKLRYLNLDGSKLVDISEDWFTTTTNLQELHLENNQIKMIGPNVFSKLSGLKKLNLEKNVCVSKNFENIKFVNIDVIPNIEQCIININMTFNMKDCTYLNKKDYTCVLSGITYLSDDDIFNIGGTHLSGKTDNDIVRIHLQNSKLFRVPNIFFDKFKNLQHLNITDVGMKIIDGNTFQSCGQLKYLFAYDNEITKLTADLRIVFN